MWMLVFIENMKLTDSEKIIKFCLKLIYISKKSTDIVVMIYTNPPGRIGRDLRVSYTDEKGKRKHYVKKIK